MQPRVQAHAAAGDGTLGMYWNQIQPCKGDADSLRRPYRAFNRCALTQGFGRLRDLCPGLYSTAPSALEKADGFTISLTVTKLNEAFAGQQTICFEGFGRLRDLCPGLYSTAPSALEKADGSNIILAVTAR